MTSVIERLAAGETITGYSEKGSSMTPLIKSGEAVTLEPVAFAEVKVGDIVLCRVSGRRYLHKVTALGPRGVQISNNHGHVNGWTRTIYGRVVK